MIEIVVTPNETKLIQQLACQKIQHKVKNLLVGDIHITHDDTPVYIIERKANTDLEASIKDGRYREQKGRLLKTGISTHNIIYLLENVSIDNEKRVWGAICNTLHRDKCTIFHTSGIEETIKFLNRLTKSIEEFGAFDPKDTREQTVNVNIKKKSVSPSEWLMYSLTLIPGCSINVAKTIVSQYSSINDLKTIPEKELANLKRLDNGRRVGPKISSAIKNYVANI